MLLPEGKRSTAWVKRLPEVVSALNNEVTSLIVKKPAVAIKEKSVYERPSTPYTRPVRKREKILPSLVQVRYLYQPGELEGGVQRATDPIWSLKVFGIERSFSKPNQPFSTICTTGPSAALCGKSCSLFLRTHNYPQRSFETLASNPLSSSSVNVDNISILVYP